MPVLRALVMVEIHVRIKNGKYIVSDCPLPSNWSSQGALSIKYLHFAKRKQRVTFVENNDDLYYQKPPVVQTFDKKTASFDPENNLLNM